MDNVALLPLVVIVWQAKYLTSFNSSWGLYLNFTISGNCVRKVFVLAYLHFWKKYPARADASKLPNVLCLLSQSCLCFSAVVSPRASTCSPDPSHVWGGDSLRGLHDWAAFNLDTITQTKTICQFNKEERRSFSNWLKTNRMMDF